ncbi:MAG: hypothetical protein ABR511_02835 [Acidimicrobiales bacterium]
MKPSGGDQPSFDEPALTASEAHPGGTDDHRLRDNGERMQHNEQWEGSPGHDEDVASECAVDTAPDENIDAHRGGPEHDGSERREQE